NSGAPAPTMPQRRRTIVPLLIVALAVVVLLVLMTKFRLNGFIALLTVAIGVALWGSSSGNLAIDGEKVGIDAIPKIITSGLGDQLCHTLLVIVIGEIDTYVIGVTCA